MKLTPDQHNKLALSYFFDTFAEQIFDATFPDGVVPEIDDDDIAEFARIATTIAVDVTYEDVVDGEVVDGA